MAINGIKGLAERAPRSLSTRPGDSTATPSRARERGTNALGQALGSRPRTPRPDAAPEMASNVVGKVYGGDVSLRKNPSAAGLTAATLLAAKGLLSICRANPQLLR
ncbi:hypothetical protein [Rhizobacter sp. OV335]|jgi:hypothetical protein|uniref:hypothetical protein n=1 Tax=Rhizobacter sp. OV335 TaxID=1500264 RepID=UPI00091D7760|nr:hypothetical protein [Rhizobacter sp. OV335]SHN16605.1 hypothetical protein SAMN02787076_03772 [Rhizobacter sp. OV335]